MPHTARQLLGSPKVPQARLQDIVLAMFFRRCGSNLRPVLKGIEKPAGIGVKSSAAGSNKRFDLVGQSAQWATDAIDQTNDNAEIRSELTGHHSCGELHAMV